MAGLAAGLIAMAGVLSVTAGGALPVPPPVALRGPASPDPAAVATEGLEFVPPTVAELVPPTSPPSEPPAPSTDVSPATSSVDPSADSPADSPDEALSPVDSDGDGSEVDVASVDSPDVAESALVDSPDSPDSPDSADSPDD